MTTNTQVLPRAAARPHAPASMLGALAAALLFVPRHLARWVRRRRDVRHLSSMDDRILQDLGISRAGIERAVFRGRS